jgi:hypothetical protein
MAICFINDHHWRHAAARSFYRRPFSSLAEMESMTDRWNMAGHGTGSTSTATAMAGCSLNRVNSTLGSMFGIFGLSHSRISCGAQSLVAGKEGRQTSRPRSMTLLLAGRLVGAANRPCLLPNAADLVHSEESRQLDILNRAR